MDSLVPGLGMRLQYGQSCSWPGNGTTIWIVLFPVWEWDYNMDSLVPSLGMGLQYEQSCSQPGNETWSHSQTSSSPHWSHSQTSSSTHITSNTAGNSALYTLQVDTYKYIMEACCTEVWRFYFLQFATVGYTQLCVTREFDFTSTD